MAARQAPPSLGFSRQEHWSGLPFPSPMHESEKWKCNRSVISNSSATPWTTAYQAPPSMGFSRQEYWSGVPLPSPTVSQSLLKFMFIEFMMLSNHLILCHPLLTPSIFPSIRAFFQWIGSSHQVAKVLELELQDQSFQWILRVDFL